MMSSEEILSPNDLLLDNFQLAESVGVQGNLYIYKKGTPLEMQVVLDEVPHTVQQYFELALKMEVEISVSKKEDAEIRDFYDALSNQMPTLTVLNSNLLISLKKAESLFFTRTQKANRTYQEKLQTVELELNPYLEQEILQDMLSEVNAAVLQQGELIHAAILQYTKEKRKLAKANESHELFERVANLKSNPKSQFVINLLMDAAIAGHHWASVLVKSQLQEIKLENGISIWLPRKLLAHELYKLKADLEITHEGNYYRVDSPAHAKMISEDLFASQACLL